MKSIMMKIASICAAVCALSDITRKGFILGGVLGCIAYFTVTTYGVEAYYTKLIKGATFEQDECVGNYPDVIISLGDSAEVCFWRGAGYRPYYKTQDSIFEFEPVATKDIAYITDVINRHSYVKIISCDSDSMTVVHWRYADDLNSVSLRNFTDEYFTFCGDGIVYRSVFGGTPKLDDYFKSVIQYKYILSGDGIRLLSSNEALYDPLGVMPAENKATKEIAMSAVELMKMSDNALYFHFDEGSGENTVESMTNRNCRIAGDKALWRQGVSGYALEFNGYESSVIFDRNDVPPITNAVTLEASIALAAYPWNWTPVVHQSEWEKSGYYLGVDAYGHIGFMVGLDNGWHSVVSDETINPGEWHRISGVYDKGKMSVFIDGKLKKSAVVSAGATIILPQSDLVIGKGDDMIPTDAVREKNTFASSYGFEGLIDEVGVTGRALEDSEISGSKLLRSGHSLLPDLCRRGIPNLANEMTGKRFGAFYKTLGFTESWDNRWRLGNDADVVVTFDKSPVSFVLWHGMGYIPAWITENNIWYTNEFNEDWNWDQDGCYEPMSDKHCYFNQARIIESSDARALIHWRYPLIGSRLNMINVDSVSGWSDWVDEYYYVYPDGVILRNDCLWTLADPAAHEWHEAIIINDAYTSPQDNVDMEHPFSLLSVRDNERQSIMRVNTLSDYKPFMIWTPRNSNVRKWGGTWNHWPVGDILSDGRNAVTNDRVSHTTIGTVENWDFHEVGRNYAVKNSLTGISDMDDEGLIHLAKSWQSPPVATSSQCSVSYSASERAYIAQASSSFDGAINIGFNASVDSPVHNICLVMKHWNRKLPTTVLLDGNPMPEGKYRASIVKSNRGSSNLILWIELKSDNMFEIEII